MKALGVDLGERRIGLAISAGTVAIPHATLERSDDPAVDREAIVDAARDAGCDTVVVGMPRTLAGQEGRAAVAARAEVEAIRALAPDLVVVDHDERFTSVIAEQRLQASGMRSRRRRQVVDETAAAVMLQSFLEHVG